MLRRQCSQGEVDTTKNGGEKHTESSRNSNRIGSNAGSRSASQLVNQSDDVDGDRMTAQWAVQIDRYTAAKLSRKGLSIVN